VCLTYRVASLLRKREWTLYVNATAIRVVWVGATASFCLSFYTSFSSTIFRASIFNQRDKYICTRRDFFFSCSSDVRRYHYVLQRIKYSCSDTSVNNLLGDANIACWCLQWRHSDDVIPVWGRAVGAGGLSVSLSHNEMWNCSHAFSLSVCLNGYDISSDKNLQKEHITIFLLHTGYSTIELCGAESFLRSI
jgi:hypothetical protein